MRNEIDDLLQEPVMPPEPEVQTPPAPETPPKKNPYVAILDEIERQKSARTREVMRAQADTSPDTRAEAIKLAKQYRENVEFVERNLDFFRQKAKRDAPDFEYLLERAPKFVEWLNQNPAFAGAAQDDFDAMTRASNTVEFGGALLRGIDSQQAMFGRFVEWSGELVGSKRVTAYGRDVARFNEAQVEALGKKTTRHDIHSVSDFAQYLKELIGDQIPVLTPMIAGGITGAAIGAAVTGPAAPIGATIGGFIGAFVPAFVMDVGETQQTLKQIDENAVAPWTVLVGGSAVALLDSSFPGYIGSFMVRTLGRETAEQAAKRILLAPVKPEFIRTTAKGAVVGFATEGFTEAVQEVLGNITGAIGTDTPINWPETWDQAVEAGLAGALMGGMAEVSVNTLTHRTQVARYAAAQQQKLFFDALAATATDSKLRERLPEAFANYVEKLTADGPVANIYIDADEFITYFQSVGVNPDLVAKELTGSETALAEAQEAGTKLRVPTGEFAAKIAATEHYAHLAQDITLDPEVPTPRQHEAFRKALDAQADALEATLQKALKGEALETVELTPVQAALAEALAAEPQFQRLAAREGVDAPAAARAYAIGLGAIADTMGERYGFDPVDLMTRYGLVIGQTPIAARAVAEGEAIEGAPEAQGGPAAGEPTEAPAAPILGRTPLGPSMSYWEDMPEEEQAAYRADALERRRALVGSSFPFAATFAGEQVQVLSHVRGNVVLIEHADGTRAQVRGSEVRAEGADRPLLPVAPPRRHPLAQPVRLEQARRKGPQHHTLELAPMRVVDGHLQPSTRVPTAVDAVPESTEPLQTRLPELLRNPTLTGKIADTLRGVANIVSEDEKALPAAEFLEAFVQRVSENLRWLYSLAKDELDFVRTRGRLWYAGAHRIAMDLALEYDYTVPQAAALMAILSPKVNWDKNVAYAIAISEAVRRADKDTTATFTLDMAKHSRARMIESWQRQQYGQPYRLRQAIKNAKTKKAREAAQQAYDSALKKYKQQTLIWQREITGRLWTDLSDMDQAKYIRAYVELGDLGASYVTVLPEGEFGPVVMAGERPAKMGWTTFPITARAIKLIRDGSFENIHRQIGDNHKVRSFFANIADPWNPNAVTIDTQAVAAGHLEPLVTNSPEVKATMNGPGNNTLGIYGTNPVYAEAYFRVAEELGLLPRELQSITWEIVRGLFYWTEKSADLRTLTEGLWQQVHDGKLTREDFYGRLLTAVNGVRRPRWGDQAPRVAFDESRLRQGHVLAGATGLAARAGRRGRGAQGSARRLARLPDGPVRPQVGTETRFAQGAGPGRVSPETQRRLAAIAGVLGALHRRVLQPYLRRGGAAPEGIRGLVAASYDPHADLAEGFAPLGVPAPVLHELTATAESAAWFHSQIVHSKTVNPHAASVYVYSEEEYAGMRMFVTDDLRAGLAVKTDGDLVSGFSLGGGYIHALIAAAVAHGGATHCDCFDTILPFLYAANGFRVVRREAWVDEFAPPDWNFETFKRFNNGRPDVVYLQYDPSTLTDTGEVKLSQDMPPLDGRAWTYSRLARAAELSQLVKASGKQWKATLQNSKLGISQDEFLFAHVDDLEDGTVYTKQEVLDYLKVNQLQVAWATFSSDQATLTEVEERAHQLLEEWAEDQVERLEDVGVGPREVPAPTVVQDEDGSWSSYIGEELVTGGEQTEQEARDKAEDSWLNLTEEAAKKFHEEVYATLDYSEAEEEAERLIDFERNDRVRFSEYRFMDQFAEEGSYREVLLHAPQFGYTGYTALTADENQALRELGGIEYGGPAHPLERLRGAEFHMLADAPDLVVKDRIRRMLTDVIADVEETLRREEKLQAKLRQKGVARAGHLDNLAVRHFREGLRILKKLQAADNFTWRAAGWKDGHSEYADVENPIVRLRFDVRTLEDGRKTLFLDEVQPPAKGNFDQMPEILQKQWREIAFKWALAHAVDLGVETLSWTKGQIQSDRYALSRAVDRVSWDSVPVGTPAYEAGGRKMVRLAVRGQGHWQSPMTLRLMLDENQKVTMVTSSPATEPQAFGKLVGEPIARIIGNEMTERVTDKPKGSKSAFGQDISVGGEGLRRLYDVDFRNVVNNLKAVKKNKGRVGAVRIKTGEEAGMPVPARLTAPGAGFDQIQAWLDTHPHTARWDAMPGLEITPAIKAAVEAGQELFQGERGFIKWGPDRQMTIGIPEQADLSTLLHEFGHFYLEVLGDLAGSLSQVTDPSTLPPGRAGLLRDYQTILEFLGVTSRDELGVEQHEKFARAFEAYLLEGRAPSAQVKGAFARFRSWLLNIYKSVAYLRVTLTPEVRGVFDRLVATDAAIAEAEREANLKPFFATAEDAGMSPAEFNAYLETARQESERARDDLQARVMRELQRERKVWWREQKKQVRQAVLNELNFDRTYRALAALQRGTTPSGEPLPEGAIKIDKDSIVQRYGADRLRTLPKPWVYAIEGGIDVEAAAELFGFSSGDELISALAGAQKLDARVEEETNARMKVMYGDMLAEGTFREVAKQAVQEHHDAILAKELRAISKKVREVRPFVVARRTVERAEERATRRAGLHALRSVPPLDVVRAVAEQRIARMPLRDIRPQEFWAAAQNAAAQAVEAGLAGNFERAYEQKQRQRLAAQLYRAATRALDEGDAILRYMQRFDSDAVRARIGKAGESYLAQIDALRNKFEFAKVSNKALDRRGSLATWVAEREADGFSPNIPADLLEAAQQTNYRSVPLEQLREVRDAVREIEQLSRVKFRLLKNAETRSFEKAKGAVLDSIEQHRNKRRRQPVEFRAAEKRRLAIADWFAMHAKIARLARALDGYLDAGPVWRFIIRPLNEAADAEVTRRQVEGERLSKIIQRHYGGGRLALWNRKVFIPQVGASLSLEGRLAIALNWGNESSRERVLNDPSLGWTREQVRAVLNTLDRQDWLFVQDVWDFVDSFWQEISDKHQRVTGLRPKKVEAVPVETAHGTFRGGYYPLAYDSRKASRPGQVEAANEAKLRVAGAYVHATTRRGHEKARLEHVELPLRLDLGVLFQHVDQVIHDLTHHETLIDVNRFVRDRQISTAIIQAAGSPVYQQFTKALEDIALGHRPGTNAMDRAATFMRSGTQIAALGWNLWTALQQPLGLFNGAAHVGPIWVARGMGRWLRDASHLENTSKWINEVSPFMRSRSITATQDLNDLRNRLARPGSWFDRMVRSLTADKANQQLITDSFLWHIGLAQRLADIPTWLGMYEKAMAQHGGDEQLAFRLADQAVRDAQGGGQVVDLAQVQRGGPIARLFMAFYSYGNTVFNSTAEMYGRTRFTSPLQVVQFLGNLSLLYVFPALGTVVLSRAIGRTGAGEDEPADFLTELGQEILSTALNTMVFLRELGGLVQSGTRGYAGPSGARFLKTLYDLGAQVKQLELDEAFWRQLNAVAGVIFHYPAAQVQRSVDGFVALQEGETENPAALVVGPERRR